jgi:hypothetical protein
VSILHKDRISASERNRVLDYLTFKIKHGANISTALRSYMEGNRTKASRPVQVMLEHMTEGISFQDAALTFGLVDRYGFLVLDSGIEASKSLPVVRDTAVKMNFGVTAILIREIVAKYALALLLAAAMASQAVRNPLIKIFDVMNMAVQQTSATPILLPLYLKSPWYVMQWVLFMGVIIALAGGIAWWLNRYHSDLIYRILRFRFYEDWSTLLALYIAFKHAGHSDVRAALSLAASCPEGSFNQKLFENMAESMRSSGLDMYEILGAYEGTIPTEVLAFFMDAEKTGQYDAYIQQAKAFCDSRLAAITEATRIWVPTITGITLMLVFGLIAVDMFVKLTELTMAPLM